MKKLFLLIALLALPRAANATIQLAGGTTLQCGGVSCGAHSNATTSLSFTFDALYAQTGNMVIVSCMVQYNKTCNTPTDTLGSTWTILNAQFTESTVGRMESWATVLASGGGDTVTVTPSSSTFMSVSGIALSGTFSLPSSIDQVTAAGNTTGGNCTDCITSGSTATTATSSEFLYGWGWIQTGTLNHGTGYTTISAQTNGAALCLSEYQSVSSVGTYAATESGNAAGSTWAISIATIKESALIGTTKLVGNFNFVGGMKNTGGSDPTLNVSPSSVSWGSRMETVVESPQSVTITNIGTSSISISSFSLNNTDYTQTNTCGGSVAAGASCTVSVLFAPTVLGADNATLTIHDNSAGSPHSVNLTGTGIASSVAFTCNFSSGTVLTTDAPPGCWAFNNDPNGTPAANNSSAPLYLTDTNNVKIRYLGNSGSIVDDNEWLSTILSPTCTDCFFRAQLYLATPDGGLATGDSEARKLMQVSDSASASGGTVVSTFNPILTTFTFSGGHYTTTNNVAYVQQVGSSCGTPSSPVTYGLGTIPWATWTTVEWELKLNTPGASDGVVNVWINGVQTANLTGQNIRGTCSTPIQFFALGRQTDNDQTVKNAIAESRYWARVVAATNYIGP